MEHTGHIKINRKNVPYHLVDDKVTLIPFDTYSALIPSEIKEKEIIKGITTGNREVAFLNCKYSSNRLAYQVLIISSCNTGLYEDILSFDRICFEGKPVNVFAGPGRAYISEDGYDISKRMKSITPRNWDDLNAETNLKIKNREMKNIVETLDSIESTIGKENFIALFKSITFDNGTEFRDFKGMSKSIFDNESRTKIYYANPYHSWERGSNENGNRMMRKFFSKGTDFSTISEKSILKATNLINYSHRKLLNNSSSAELLKNLNESYFRVIEMLGLKNPYRKYLV